jgi:predicted DNA-binding mobile mystery protein A
MPTHSIAYKARTSLDSRLRQLGGAQRYAVPPRGWVRAIRDALGMSAEDLGRRMGVTGPAVFSLERSEQAGTVRLDTLSRAAQALDCTLVYAFIPNRGLEETVTREAEQSARRQLAHVRGTMALEDQAIGLDDSLVRTHAEQLVKAGRVWAANP